MNAPRLAGIVSLAALSLAALLGAAGAQLLPPQNVPGGPPPGVQGPRPMYPQPDSPVCLRLEAQLAQLDSAAGGGNPEQARRYEDAIQRQRFELDQTIVQARRLGCDTGGSFFLFGQPRHPQCDLLNNQIGRMRSNLDRMISELGNLRGGGTDMNRDLQRRQLVNQLAQSNCGPQYRQAAAQQQPPRPRSLLEAIFGSGLREESTIDQAPLDMPMGSGTYRTVCVRTCDGFFFPISFATVPARFGEDELTCKRLCPAAETMLFSHRNPGEEIEQAVSTHGTPYTELPNAFKYRQALDTSCSCRAAGQSWADALGVERDETLQRGDILVTEQRSKQMSQPRPMNQKGALPPAGTAKGTPAPEQTAAPSESAIPPAQLEAQPARPAGDRRVRIVGPQFYPVR